VFSPNDPREDVARDPEKFDEGFMTYLDGKIDGSTDLEERAALGSLRDIIKEVLTRVEVVVDQDDVLPPDAATPTQSEAVEVEVQEKSNEEVFAEMRKMQGIDSKVDQERKAEEDLAAKAQIMEGYGGRLGEILAQVGQGEKLPTVVEAYYDQLDLQFIETIKAKSNDPSEGSNNEVYAAILGEINKIMAVRYEKATATLQQILEAGHPKLMEMEITKVAARGGVDEALLLLLEGNILQAKQAGVAQAAQVMEGLLQVCQSEVDRKMDPEKKLLRQLLRTDDTNARKKMLEAAFKPKEAFVLASSADQNVIQGGGSSGQQESKKAPDVAPPAFIAECKAVIEQFGNIEDTSNAALADRLRKITDEAEGVATSIYGESMTAREQQDKMWNEGTISVFDLEKIENAAEAQGEAMPWKNDGYDHMTPVDVLTQKGKIDIGGMEGF